jgi:hypothetical protein
MVIGILFGVLFFLIFGGGAYYQWSIKKKVIDHVLCTFITPVGTSYDVLMPYKGNWVEPPKGVKHGKKGKLPRHRLPNTMDKLPTVLYPLAGVPRILCSEVKRVFYMEGNPKPIATWDVSTEAIGESLEVAYDIEAAKSIVKDLRTDEDKPVGLGLKPTYLWIALGVIGIISLVGAILTYLSYSQPATYW